MESPGAELESSPVGRALRSVGNKSQDRRDLWDREREQVRRGEWRKDMNESAKIFTFTESELEAVIMRAVQLALTNMNGAGNHNGNGRGHGDGWLTPEQAAE